MLTDDLPWPELGNISRGATRGNQGQKGVLGPPDRDGRCMLQLRVQPGVLAVRLNKQASDWYRVLDGEVNRALKLTKTYWRKARRRQDYDSRADQDHMELHEWLQQLKDKTMTHLELLMQKGDIQGPPYLMPDNVELTFLRKFIERQSAGIPHNPRLRRFTRDKYPMMHERVAEASISDSERDYMRTSETVGRESNSEASSSQQPPSSLRSLSPTQRHFGSVMREADSSKQALQGAREALTRAQQQTQDAFLKYTTCLETERLARHEVASAERQRDDIMAAILVRSKSADANSRHSSLSGDEHQSPSMYHRDVGGRSMDIDARSDMFVQKMYGPPAHAFRPSLETPRTRELNGKPMSWSESDGRANYSDDPAHIQDPHKTNRKHSRYWGRGETQEGQYASEADYQVRGFRKVV